MDLAPRMMKTVFKSTVFSILGFFVFSNVLVFPPIYAQEDAFDRTGTGRGICARLDAAKTELGDRLSSRRAALGAKRDQLRDKFLERRDERQSRRAERREVWAARFEEHFAKLREGAETDEQKEAVEEFVEAIQNAIVTRRAAVDAAAAAYYDGVLALRESRKTDVLAVTGTFNAAVSAAFDAARSDCDNGVAPETVRTTLRESLASARDAFVSDLKAVEKPRDVLEPLRTTRRDAIRQANADFKAEIEAARDVFKTKHDTAKGV